MSTFKNIPTPGSEAWKDNVATTADLPLTNNVTGDKRQVLDTKTIYSWNGGGWTAIASPAAAIAITGLLGDVTATGPGAVNATLKTVNLTPGSFGTASSVPSIAVNGKGLVTSSSNTPIQIAQSQVDNLVTALSGKFNNPAGTISDYIRGDGSIAAFPEVANKLSKGTKTIFCIDNGDYATLQAAVNAASAGDTILVGAKSGGWGDVVIPDNLVGKKLSIIGLQAARCPFVRVGAITFSPTLETQLTENELYLQNLYITSSTSACITFGGNKGARIRIDGCFIDAGLAMNSVALNNTVATSSAYIYNSLIQATTGTTIVSSTPYVRIYRSAVENTGTILLSQTAGFLESNDVNWSGARAGEIISIANGANFICGKSLIVNTTTNGSGVLLGGVTAVIANSNNSWQIATGTGYCIRGVGVHLYGPYLTANSVALAYNVKIQNTITQIPYTLTFTPSP